MRDLHLGRIKNLSVPEILKQNPYCFHLDEYPPKICHQKFDVPFILSDLWSSEDTRHISLNMSIPMYDQRWNFNDLFNFNIKKPELVKPHIETMEEQAKIVMQQLRSDKYKPFHIDYITISGGNLSILDQDQLNRTLDIVEEIFQTPVKVSKLSVGLHPVCSEDFLEILLERNVHRIRMGVQSFLERDLKRLYVSTSIEKIHDNLESISTMGFPQLSVDLLYGIEDQSVKNFLASIEQVINHEPDELFLNPIYISPNASVEIGEENILVQNQGIRPHLYKKGRERLLDAGFHQDSMRRFVKKRSMRVNTFVDLQKYNYTLDSTIGIGCEITSCTKNVHYSESYANSQHDLNRCIHNYIEKNPADFSSLSYGIQLSDEEKRRRFILKSLLRYKGLDTESYRREFGVEPQREFPELMELVDLEVAHKNGSYIALTEFGLALSDIVEPWLYSTKVTELMEEIDG